MLGLSQVSSWLRVLAFGVVLSALAFSQAQAALELERSTTLRDAFGGSFTALSSGQVDLPGRMVTTEASFNDFHPDDENRVVNGTLTRQLTRLEGERIGLVNGELIITNQVDGTTESLNVGFVDLRFFHDGDSREISGQLVVNGVVYEASDMPRRVAQTVRRLLHFLR